MLVEPGTPAGFANISAARTQVLEGGRAVVGGSSGGKQAAHVLAPCPHDGACPLESRRSWCHFVQRFQRTGLQVGVGSAGGWGAWGLRASGAVPQPPVHMCSEAGGHSISMCGVLGSLNVGALAACSGFKEDGWILQDPCRTSLPCMQRLSKSVGGKSARTYQDERFSYVVLARWVS